MMKVKLALLLTLVLVSLCSCSNWVKQLPGKYRLVSANGSDRAIVNAENSFIIIPNIDGIAITTTLILGHNEPCKEYDDGEDPKALASKRGYFIINAKTDKIMMGLKHDAWIEILRKRYKIKNVNLYRPTNWETLDENVGIEWDR